MKFTDVIALFGGLAFFLYGMDVLSSGLERMAGGKLERALKAITSNRLRCLLLGLGITAAIQSSSAVTVMLVGLVNSGIMTLRQSIGVIMGSNIGTTMTAWILTLAGVESDNFWISLLNPENFSLIFAFIGVVMIMVCKDTKKKDIGNILAGFAVLMYGMKLMSNAVEPLSNSEGFTNLLLAFKNPILGVLVGLFITAVIQSSSASVGILQALAMTGVVSYGAAIPIIMGQNIGTCVTALISSFGVGRNAKKVAVVHIAFNVIGTIVCLSAYCILDAIFDFAFADLSVDQVGIAIIHTSFNVFTTALLLPFSSTLENFANKILPEVPEKKKTSSKLLDRRLLATPSIAISECDNLATNMATIAMKTLRRSISLIHNYDKKIADKIVSSEDTLDKYEDELGTYLVQLSPEKLSDSDSLRVSKILHAIGDFERLGDHAVNLMKAAQEMHDKGISFSPAGQKELAILIDAISEILDITEEAYTKSDVRLAMRVEPLEQTIDVLVMTVKDNHVKRLQSGECSILPGFVLSDILNNLERISDHCSNIAVAVIELAHHSFDTHKYLSGIRSENQEYRDAFDAFSAKYQI
ncbi:MAG TPA: Na/Pi cotransporter family protein [Candidatus Faeciplasma pullistercoris]|uniref:Na/Pi cotransporter family protein n=1 Tax=Candidatus Faeciplasma pullistercoris TaxID=2840800 RepID=A0A9D1GST1_9FIRM|nr:Na/Pi cotransporter family protein [Candidatus Faeciplasma pullistercoris]